MTRTREVEPGSEETPDYKSPANRLVHSLRKGYDNLRVKLKKSRNQIKYYQIKIRDLEISRSKHKEESKSLEAKFKQLEKENKRLTKHNAVMEQTLKKSSNLSSFRS